MSQSRRCPYCQSSFLPSVYRPQQSVCSRPECQRRRRSDYHRRKVAMDPEYFQVVRDSQKQWWDMETGLERIAAKARSEPKLRFTSLAHHVTRERVWENLCQIPKDSSPGVDGQTVTEAKQSFGE